MSTLEASFERLLQQTVELREELRLANEQLAIRDSTRNRETRTAECELEEGEEGVEDLRIESAYDIGER